MRKHIITTLVAVAAGTLGLVGTALPASAALTYNPKAALSGDSVCKSGVTKQKVVFTNYNAKRRVQFNLRRMNDAAAPAYVAFYVAPGDHKVAWVSVRSDETVSLRVRSPESTPANYLMLSEVITALPGCRQIVRDPQAALGGTTCVGADSVVTINLDNRASTDEPVQYTTTAVQPGSTTTDVTTVPQRTLRNTYVIARSGVDPVHIEVHDGAADGPLLLARDVPARSC